MNHVTEKKFTEEIRRLERCYVYRYQDQIFQEIWNICQELTEEEFLGMLKKLEKEHKSDYLPKPKDFKALMWRAIEVRNREWASVEERAEWPAGGLKKALSEAGAESLWEACRKHKPPRSS